MNIKILLQYVETLTVDINYQTRHKVVKYSDDLGGIFLLYWNNSCPKLPIVWNIL